MEIRRGTTPEITYKSEYLPDYFDTLWLTLKQGTTELTKEKSDVVIEGNDVKVKLTQDETLSFKVGSVSLQLRGRIGEEAVADKITSITVADVLKDGRIGD